MSRILLLEDDLGLIDGLIFALEKNGFEVAVVRTITEAATVVLEQKFDILLLDLTLPDGSGFEICRKVRKTSNVPIIFLTASDEEVNIVMGLDIGGDDYITKPFRLNELISRINALLRRSNIMSKSGGELVSNGITVVFQTNKVEKDAKEIELTAAEFRLLCLLMQNPNTVLTRTVLLDRLWDGSGSFVDDNTLSVYVSRLRAKVEENPEKPKFLLTVRGVGYKWKIIN